MSKRTTEQKFNDLKEHLNSFFNDTIQGNSLFVLQDLSILEQRCRDIKPIQKTPIIANPYPVYKLDQHGEVLEYLLNKESVVNSITERLINRYENSSDLSFTNKQHLLSILNKIKNYIGAYAGQSKVANSHIRKYQPDDKVINPLGGKSSIIIKLNQLCPSNPQNNQPSQTDSGCKLF